MHCASVQTAEGWLWPLAGASSTLDLIFLVGRRPAAVPSWPALKLLGALLKGSIAPSPSLRPFSFSAPLTFRRTFPGQELQRTHSMGWDRPSAPLRRLGAFAASIPTWTPSLVD